MTQINRTRGPVQSTQKGSEPNQNTNTIRPSRNISTSNVTSINLNPRIIQETRRAREININPNIKLTNLRPAPLIPNKRIRSRTTFTIMINRDPSNSNHEAMQISHDRILVTTSLKQPTPGINQHFSLMTTTKISSNISLNITLLINQSNSSMLNIIILSMTLHLRNPNRFTTPSTNHVLDKSNQIAILNQRKRLSQAIGIKQTTNATDNIKVVNSQMTRPVSLPSNNSTPEFSTLNSLQSPRDRQKKARQRSSRASPYSSTVPQTELSKAISEAGR